MSVLKKVFTMFLRISISIVLLTLLFKFNNIDIQLLIADLKSAERHLLLAAFFVCFLNFVLGFWRWEMLLKAVKIQLPLKRILISYSGGIFFNLFMPSTIGGDLTRSIDLAVHTKRPREVVATVFLDRLSGYVGMTIVVLFSLFFGWELIKDNKLALISVTIIAVILVAILLVLFNRRIYSVINRLLRLGNAGRVTEVIKNLHHEIHIFRNKRRVLFKSLLLSVAIQTISPAVFFIIALSFGIKINIVYFFIFVPIISAISLLPVSLGGLGIRESMTVLFFAKAGMSQGMALGMSLLSFFFNLAYGALGGLIYVLTVHHRRIQHHQPPAFHAKP